RARDTVPTARMLSLDANALSARARALADRLASAGWRVELVDGQSAAGGGSAPGVGLPTVLVAVEGRGLSAAAIEQALRAMDTPIVARIADGRVVLDPRTFSDEEAEEIARLM